MADREGGGGILLALARDWKHYGTRREVRETTTRACHAQSANPRNTGPRAGVGARPAPVP